MGYPQLPCSVRSLQNDDPRWWWQEAESPPTDREVVNLSGDSGAVPLFLMYDLYSREQHIKNQRPPIAAPPLRKTKSTTPPLSTM
jgi:hypothetical protein